MTYEEAIKKLRNMKKCDTEDIIKSIEAKLLGEENESVYDICIEALKKQEKYRWHDLRKNPDDLPVELEIVNITWVNHNPVPYYADIKDKPFSDASGVYYKGKWWWWTASCEDYLSEYGESEENEMNKDIEVIAWKEIEPFKESEE